ncbi:hypothetical protein AAF712_016384 [Marasmius tenuissimus]|uniref:DDE-1 domain-containing protein n=1 Tax=Marasmius tenuissimus TaxID=585030 RepID=A0ABR2Z5V0_9AGAR
MAWSERKATKASWKLPENWEQLCKDTCYQKVHTLKEFDIPKELLVNSDQTTVVYNPGSRLIWATRGEKQVSPIGLEEKRAFMTLLSVAADGYALPIQCMFGGETSCMCPSPSAPHYKDYVAAGFELVPSGSTSAWMQENHPDIIIHFIPGNCTSTAQLLDVAVNCIFKQSLKISYLQSSEEMSFDSSIGPMHDASIGWLWDAYSRIQKKDLVKKAFEMCSDGSLDLSFKKLTSQEAHEGLRNLKETQHTFWEEITASKSQGLLVAEDERCQEDIELEEVNEDSGPIDSDVRLTDLAAHLTKNLAQGAHYEVLDSGSADAGLSSCAATEGELPELTEVFIETLVQRQGTRQRKPNKWYAGWWKHADDFGNDLDYVE